MKIKIENYGTEVFEKTTKTLDLVSGASVVFDYFDEKINVTIESVEHEFFVVSLNRPFCFEVNGIVNLSETHYKFSFPYIAYSIITLPLYDASYKLKFSVDEESL